VLFVRPSCWNLTPKEAVAFQRELAPLVSTVDRLGDWRVVVAVDLALALFAKEGRAAAVAWDHETGEVIESVTLQRPIPMPYIPGLLAFREGPLIEEALARLRSEPDVILVDGHGIIHPRRMGIGAHIGVLADRVTIGIGKTHFYGTYSLPGPEPGDRTPLYSPEGEQLGVVLRTRAGSRPIFVSPGQHISPDTAAEVVLACTAGHRLPEPLHLADRLSKAKPI
jgi:deoxyribonuclease V